MADSPHTVLIVDDDLVNLKIVFASLEASGFTVHIATNAKLALESIHRAPPDIILLDIMMPGSDGFTLAAHLKADEASRDIPIIFMTALTETVHKIKCFDLGAVDYITKPIHVAEIAARIKMHLTIRDLQKQLAEKNAQLVRTNTELTREIAEREQSKSRRKDTLAALKYRVEFERLITTLSTRFAHLVPAELDEEINRALQAIGEFDDVDRSYVFLFSDDGSLADNTHEWCAAGVEAHIHDLKDMVIEKTMPWFAAKMRQLEALHIPRVADLPAKASIEQADFQKHNIQSLVAVPMIYGGTLIGFVGFDSVRMEKTWPEDGIVLLKLVGEIFAHALKRVRVEETLAAERRALQRRNQELVLLNRAGQAFNSSLELDEVFTMVLQSVSGLLGVMDSSIWLLEPSREGRGDELVCRHLSNPQDEGLRGWRLPRAEGIVGWVVENARSVIVSDTREDARYYNGLEQHTGVETRSILAVPLWRQHTIIGVLEIVDTAPQRFGQSDLQVMESLAATASIAIQNARLYAQTQQDAQTKADLLREVNHRVSNNLTSIIGLLRAERRYAPTTDENRAAIEVMLARLSQRVTGLVKVHRMLSQSQWSPVRLSDLAMQIIQAALSGLPPQQSIDVQIIPSPVKVSPRQAGNLALVLTELATNTTKHAMDGRKTGRIVVSSVYEDDETIVLKYRDDGPGYPEAVLRREEYDVGVYLMQRLALSLQGTITFSNQDGAVTILQFETEDQDRT